MYAFGGNNLGMRLFVGVWPSADVAARLAALARPDHPAVRWTAPDNWHVTLRFLGDVGEGDAAGLLDALRGVAVQAPANARVGPVTRLLNRSILMVPVTGLDDVAAAVIAATRSFGQLPEDRAFTGHLTIGRAVGRRTVIPKALAGEAIESAWSVMEISLIRSHLGSYGARYETLASVSLGPNH